MTGPARLPTPPVALGEIARLVGGRVVGDSEARVGGFSTLEDAAPGDITFYNNPRYRDQLLRTRATAVVLADDRAGDTELDRVAVAGDPRECTRMLLDIFFPESGQAPVGVRPTAAVDDTAQVSPGAFVGDFASVGARSRIGGGAVVHGRCSIGEDVEIGEDVVLHPGVTVYGRTRIGRGSVIHAGAVIGADGFGFVRVGGVPERLRQVGRVVIGEHVEIGALSAIDRGALGDTVVGDRVKIDNHVQVGHNTRIGPDTIICGSTGISGSVTIGARVTIGGGCGINGHLGIADDAVVMGGSNVVRGIDRAGAEYAGVLPAMPARQWWRRVSRLVGKRGDDRATPDSD